MMPNVARSRELSNGSEARHSCLQGEIHGAWSFKDGREGDTQQKPRHDELHAALHQARASREVSGQATSSRGHNKFERDHDKEG